MSATERDRFTTVKEFITGDLWLAAALTILLESPPKFKVENGKTLFVFPGDDRTYRAITDYNSGVSVSAYLYAETTKRLKVEMLTRRQAASHG